MICSSANLDDMTQTPLSGRRAQAAKNDEVILAAARAVFVADPTAPIAAVAERAGVGISALYRRYASKEELLRKLCADGLDRYIAEAEAAIADDRDPWTAFAAFLHRLVDADSNSLAQKLAGTFTPTPELYAQATRAQQLNEQVFTRTTDALREGIVVDDIGLILEQVSSLKLGDAERSNQLRHRYLAMFLQALRATPDDSPLPGPAPRWEELHGRWTAG
jgi:AcrR family transcriptional regulator